MTFLYNKDKYEYHAKVLATLVMQGQIFSSWMDVHHERRIELPIIYKLVKQYQEENKKILEIGNVLIQYYPVEHEIIDKYDAATVCIKQDIIDFFPENKYDLIVSISTIEHIGFEAPEERDDAKIKKAIEHIVNNLLADGGLFVFTVPLGLNTSMDKQIQSNEIRLTNKYFMKRISLVSWEQTDDQTCVGKFYDNPYGCANKLLIGEIKK